MKRRDFITSSTLFTAGLFAGLGNIKIIGKTGLTPDSVNIPKIKLNNGILMPQLGFGTSGLNGDVCKNCVNQAISVGYRLIDTATIYGNEEFVGAGIKLNGISRDKLFITSKVWVSDFGYESTKKAFETSLAKLQTDYLDLYLIHRPKGDVDGTWKAMMEFYKAGKIRAIGISNFEYDHTKELLSKSKIKPAVNQIETHPFFQQHRAYAELKAFEIQMEGWSPFAQGRNGMFTNETIAKIGNKYGKTNAQVILRWNMERGIIAIPRTSKLAHMKENIDIFDFELSNEDMELIKTLDLNRTQFPEWG
ncbi:MAG: 2,5-diketo-D-gluconic acid reductase [Melioribacteraceae bacterium]|nr:MAG: 2,5-diketo-D-gluconic acid reductase [Melioribacteraceae bacterium]